MYSCEACVQRVACDVHSGELARVPLPTTELIKEGCLLLPRPARRIPDSVPMGRANHTR